MAVKRLLHGRKQSCSWPLGVTNSKAFTDEVRSPHLLRTRRKRIVQQLKKTLDGIIHSRANSKMQENYTDRFM